MADRQKKNGDDNIFLCVKATGINKVPEFVQVPTYMKSKSVFFFLYSFPHRSFPSFASRLVLSFVFYYIFFFFICHFTVFSSLLLATRKLIFFHVLFSFLYTSLVFVLCWCLLSFSFPLFISFPPIPIFFLPFHPSTQ